MLKRIIYKICILYKYEKFEHSRRQCFSFIRENPIFQKNQIIKNASKIINNK